VKYEEVYLRAYDSVLDARASIAVISISTIDGGRIPALTDEPPIKPTSDRRARCRSARQPNFFGSSVSAVQRFPVAC
jgi:putative transposase